LTVKIIPQFAALLLTIEDNLFYFHKINAFTFSEETKKDLTAKYTAEINDKLIPQFKKMTDFLKTIPTRFTINERNRKFTFRKRTICHLCKTVDHNRNVPEEIHALGLKVARLNAEMEK
jgi:uncharacterized protein (DUF885 family)